VESVFKEFRSVVGSNLQNHRNTVSRKCHTNTSFLSFSFPNWFQIRSLDSRTL